MPKICKESNKLPKNSKLNNLDGKDITSKGDREYISYQHHPQSNNIYLGEVYPQAAQQNQSFTPANGPMMSSTPDNIMHENVLNLFHPFPKRYLNNEASFLGKLQPNMPGMPHQTNVWLTQINPFEDE